MEIKFWDLNTEEYVNGSKFMINDSLGVYEDEGYDGMYICNHIEPHFYLNGERVA